MSSASALARSITALVLSLAVSSCSDSSSAPNGGKPALENSIAFVSDRSGTQQIYVMDSDGNNLRQLTDIPGQKADVGVSADGRTVAFMLMPNDFEEVSDIYTVASDGTALRQLTNTRDLDRHPSFSPDGGTIVFSRSDGDSASIYRMHPDGTQLENMIHHHGSDYNPVWRPGKETMLFVSDRDHLGGINSEIYSADQFGLAIHPLVEGFDPAWSPDGQKFLFKRDGQIWISDTPDGTSVRKLTSFLSSFYTPSWSPDGQRIIFTSFVQGYSAIFWVDVTDGSAPHQLTTYDYYRDCAFVAYTLH
jgi:TolB protein